MLTFREFMQEFREKHPAASFTREVDLGGGRSARRTDRAKRAAAFDAMKASLYAAGRITAKQRDGWVAPWMD